jgi:hypothetical protein
MDQAGDRKGALICELDLQGCQQDSGGLMEKNAHKMAGQIREVAFAILTALMAFNVMPGGFLDEAIAVAVGLGLIIWGICTKATELGVIASLGRKGLIAGAGIAVRFEWITDQQAAAGTAALVTVIAMAFSWKSNERAETIKQSKKKLP